MCFGRAGHSWDVCADVSGQCCMFTLVFLSRTDVITRPWPFSVLQCLSHCAACCFLKVRKKRNRNLGLSAIVWSDFVYRCVTDFVHL